MSEKRVISFLAEPSLVEAIYNAAATDAVSISDFCRMIMRRALFGSDYAPNHNRHGANLLIDPGVPYEAGE